MKKDIKKENMKILVIGLLAVAGFFGVMGVISWTSTTNDANQFENTIQAKDKDNQNVYAQGFNKVKEVAQVPKLQEKALESLYTSAIQARENGRTGELVRFVQEQNPNMDQSTFIKIQQVMEEFRNKFQQSQTELLDIENQYANLRNATFSGRVFLGSYPHIKIPTIVTSEEAQKVFSSGKSEAIDITK